MEKFKPTFDQPVTMKELLEIDDPTLLSSEFSRLNHSINHLIKSNEELLQSQSEEWCRDDPESKKVLQDAHEENLVSIAKQQERATMIKLVLEHKLGIPQNNPHYNLQKTHTNACEPSESAQSNGRIDSSQHERAINGGSSGDDFEVAGGILL